MNHLRDLPNVKGYRFIGVDHDNCKIQCVVVLDAIGCHTVQNEVTKEHCWFDLAGWLPYTERAKTGTV